MGRGGGRAAGSQAGVHLSGKDEGISAREQLPHPSSGNFQVGLIAFFLLFSSEFIWLPMSLHIRFSQVSHSLQGSCKPALPPFLEAGTETSSPSSISREGTVSTR